MNAINIKGFPEDIIIEKIQDMESQFSSLPDQNPGTKPKKMLSDKEDTLLSSENCNSDVDFGIRDKPRDAHHNNHTQKDVPTRETGKNSSAEHFLPLLTPDGCGFKFTYQKGEKNFAEKLVECA